VKAQAAAGGQKARELAMDITAILALIAKGVAIVRDALQVQGRRIAGDSDRGGAGYRARSRARCRPTIWPPTKHRSTA